jgi:hypothetical protein
MAARIAASRNWRINRGDRTFTRSIQHPVENIAPALSHLIIGIAVTKAVVASRHQALRILSTLIALFNIPSRILFLP